MWRCDAETTMGIGTWRWSGALLACGFLFTTPAPAQAPGGGRSREDHSGAVSESRGQPVRQPLEQRRATG